MRILKKVIKKLYHLIWFLSVFLLVSPRVYAMEENTNIGDTNFYTPSFATFGDVTNNQITRYEGTSSHNVYYAPQNLITSGSDTDGMAIAFTHESLFIQGYLYNVTLLVGFSDANIYPKATSNRVCINHNLAYVIDGYNSNAFCTTATVYTWDNVSPFTTYDGTQIYLGMISYIFTSPATSKSFVGVMNSSSYRQGYQILGGVYVEQLADNKTYNGLSSQDVQNIINNSGLASANSVSDVQRSINQIQSDINSSANNIIDNQQQNTQDIINNQNDNTDKTNETIENNFNSCEQKTVINNYDDNPTKGKLLDLNGNYTTFTNGSVSDYIPIEKNNDYVISPNNATLNTASFCLYDKNKTLISCTQFQNRSSISFNSGSATFLRTSNGKTSTPISITGKFCKNRLDSLNDTLNDSSIDSSDDTINNLKDKIPTNSVISDLLLLPVRFLQNFVNALGSSCSSFSLGSLYGTELFMPCINIENYLGSGIWTAIDLIISGMFIYSLRKKFIEIYENLTNLTNGGNEVE